MDSSIDKLLTELQRIASTANERVKRRTIDKLREIQYALESPEETMQRLMYGVCWKQTTPLPPGGCRCGGLFFADFVVRT